MARRLLLHVLSLALLVLAAGPLAAQGAPGDAASVDGPGETEAEQIRRSYTKYEVRIPMRDGVRLFTSIYVPNQGPGPWPILLRRTPYSVRPYDAAGYRNDLGPSRLLMEEGYIFVYQDVRGAFLSEGTFVNMRPHRPDKSGPEDTDESTDTWDTIQWLVEHVPDNNGRVGMWGISYPGFYAAAGMIDSHPALQAVSPQAPIADWFRDDFFHNGAFFLPHFFNFISRFGQPRPEPTTESAERFDHGTPDGYQFFLDLGPVKNADEKYLQGQVEFWDLLTTHPNYDEFWQARNILPHLDGVTAAVMTVGGWYDAEDLYGPLHVYRSVEEKNPGIFNMLVMGPWVHGGWARTPGDSLGAVSFGFETSPFYQEHIEAVFFRHYLKQDPPGPPPLPEAYVFETGANRWRTFADWPPAATREEVLYLRADGGLATEPPPTPTDDTRTDPGDPGYDEYVSDPAKPVPFTEVVDEGMTREYMVADQRFAGRRPDVLVWQTEPLAEDLTLAGPITADLWVSTSGTASDWVVKVIDVYPPDTPDPEPSPTGVRLGNYWQMVRSEVIRGRFRNSHEHPEPFEPDVPTRVTFELQDLLHTFRRGHRIMVQIQSTWFPMVDRNPQTWVPNIFEAGEEDFRKATQRVYRTPEHPTRLVVGVLPGLGESPSEGGALEGSASEGNGQRNGGS